MYIPKSSIMLQSMPINNPNEHDSDEEDDEGWTVRKIQKLAKTQGKLPSPIDINVIKTVRITLPPLEWHNYEIQPKKMKITNSGQTLILSAKWHGIRPYVTGGCLDGKYVMSQIHFHWGKDPLEGSEHTVEGRNYPLEMHVVHFKSFFQTQKEALKYPHGITTFVYFFEIKSQDSPILQNILSHLSEIRISDTAIAIKPFIINSLIFPMQNDYYMYWGSVTSTICDYTMLWIVSRHTGYISIEQQNLFHLLLDRKMRIITKNCRFPNPLFDREIFYCNPKYPHTNSTLSPVPLGLDLMEDCQLDLETV